MDLEKHRQARDFLLKLRPYTENIPIKGNYVKAQTLTSIYIDHFCRKFDRQLFSFKMPCIYDPFKVLEKYKDRIVFCGADANASVNFCVQVNEKVHLMFTTSCFLESKYQEICIIDCFYFDFVDALKEMENLIGSEVQDVSNKIGLV